MAFSVKINDKSLRNVQENVRIMFDRVIKNRKLMQEIGETIITDVKFQTRRGISIPEDGKRFNPLTSAQWIKTRAQIDAAGGTHEAFGLRKSNLTVSGQLMDSMTAETAPGQVKVIFKGIHKPYKAAYATQWTRKAHTRGNAKVRRHQVYSSRSGNRTIGKPILNDDLARWVAEQGRPFFGVRLLLQKRINTMIIAAIRRAASVARLFK